MIIQRYILYINLDINFTIVLYLLYAINYAIGYQTFLVLARDLV